MPISLQLSNRLRDCAAPVCLVALITLSATVISGCAVLNRKQPPVYFGQAIQVRPIAAADLATIKAQAAEAQAAAAEFEARTARGHSGE